MLDRLRSLISAAAVVELHSARFRVRDLDGELVFEFEPTLSLDADQKVVAVGRPIPASAVKTHAPFANPAALTAEPRLAQLILSFAYSKLGSSKWLKPSPRVVLSIVGDAANGIIPVDDKVLVDLSTFAGARTTVVHRGKALADNEALKLLDSQSKR